MVSPFRLFTFFIHTLKPQESVLKTIASLIVKRNFYVVDLVPGADSIFEGEEIFECCKKSCFEIRKLSSNSMEVLDSIPDSLRETVNLRFDKSHAVRELRIQWNSCKDFFLLRTIKLSAGTANETNSFVRLFVHL